MEFVVFSVRIVWGLSIEDQTVLKLYLKYFIASTDYRTIDKDLECYLRKFQQN